MAEHIITTRNYNDPHLHEVVMWGGQDILTNVLRAIAVFRRKNPGLLPSAILLSKFNRMDWLVGDEIVVEWSDAVALKDAIYLSYYQPFMDETDIREPRIKPAKREPVVDKFNDIYKER